MKPKTWAQVYPQGTKEGDEEQVFFIGRNKQSGLARHPQWEWRSIAAIVKESGLSRERVEQILEKYYKLGMVFQNPKNPDNWGYWERVPTMVLPQQKTIAASDKSKRIDEHLEECA